MGDNSNFKIVVLGRDGVVNDSASGGAITADAWQPLPGSLEAIARLSRAGIRVAVVTNQQGIRDGQIDVEDLHDVHEKMLSLVQEAGGTIDAIFFSTTGNAHSHGSRQPKVALLEQIRARYRIEHRDMVVIGDSHDDLDSAAQVGAQALLVQTGKGREMLAELHRFDGVTVYSDLAAAVDALLAA